MGKVTPMSVSRLTEAVWDVLSRVNDPEIGKPITELDMVERVAVGEDGHAQVKVLLTIAGCPMRGTIEHDVHAALQSVEGLTGLDLEFGVMSDEQRAELKTKLRGGVREREIPFAKDGNLTQVILVASGKGGVGKSSVTALLAVALQRRGFKVGVLDADITGPSVPRLFGLARGDVRGSDLGMLPAITRTGIRAISINLFVENEDAPVILRGPMISGTILQFWNDVIWGKLDYLLVDMPPGTSDASLTVMRNLPLNGVVLVTTPQELAGMVVRKGANMLKQLNVKVLGVVENMSYYPCPETGTRHEIFGPGHGAEIAAAVGVPLLARLPIDPQVTAAADAGEIESVTLAEADALAAQMPAPVFAPPNFPASFGPLPERKA